MCLEAARGRLAYIPGAEKGNDCHQDTLIIAGDEGKSANFT